MVMVKDKNTNTQNAQKQRLIILTCISGVLVLPPVLFLLQVLLGSFPGPLAQLTARLQSLYDKSILISVLSVLFFLRLFGIKVMVEQPGMRAAKITALLCNCVTLITALRLYENTAIQDIVQFATNWFLGASVPQIIVIGIVLLAFLGVFIWMVHRASKDPISKPTPGGDPVPQPDGGGETPNDPPKGKSKPFISIASFDITRADIRSFFSAIFFLIAVAGAVYFSLLSFELIEEIPISQPIIVVASAAAWAAWTYLERPRDSSSEESYREQFERGIVSPISLFVLIYVIKITLSGGATESQLWGQLTSLFSNHVLASFVVFPFLLFYLIVIVQTFFDILFQSEQSIAKDIRNTVVTFEKKLIELVDELLTTTLDTLRSFITESAGSMMKVFFKINLNDPDAKSVNTPKDTSGSQSSSAEQEQEREYATQ